MISLRGLNGDLLCPLLAHSVNSDSYLEWSLSEA